MKKTYIVLLTALVVMLSYFAIASHYQYLETPKGCHLVSGYEVPKGQTPPEVWSCY